MKNVQALFSARTFFTFEFLQKAFDEEWLLKYLQTISKSLARLSLTGYA